MSGGVLSKRGKTVSRKPKKKNGKNEPLAKVVSGNLLPHFGVFLSWIFDPWNHHASQSIPKIHSKWDCILSTQTFASGSEEVNYLRHVHACLRKRQGIRHDIQQMQQPHGDGEQGKDGAAQKNGRCTSENKACRKPSTYFITTVPVKRVVLFSSAASV